MTSDSQQTIPKTSLLTSSAESEGTNSVHCGICRRQFSRYTCPKCNLQYCSLICFRSQEHAACSEQFYKNELETDIRTDPSQTADERRRMMELLRRFEEEAVEDESALLKLDEDDDEDEDDLACRLGSLDIDQISYDHLWEVLTPAERKKFLAALNDPSSEITRLLLNSEEFENQIILPWWEAPVLDQRLHVESCKRYGQRPKMFSLSQGAMDAATKSSSSGPSLLFNILAILIVYSYTTRSLSTSPLSSISEQEPEYNGAKRLIAKLAPFLTDRRSKTVLPSLSGIITDLWSRFDTDVMTEASFALLLRDAAKLLRPAAVISLQEAPSQSQSQLYGHSNSTALLALSDLSELLRERTQDQKPSPPNPSVAKLAFYAARIIGTPAQILNALCDEAVARADLLEREGTLRDQPINTYQGSSSAYAGQVNTPRIEELS